MDQENNNDPYSDKISRCLINKFGIKDKELLSKIEIAYSSRRAWEINNNNLIPQTFDLEHLKAIHGYIFGDCYDWAGKVRTVEISKGESQFAPKKIIESGSSYIFNQLKKDNYLKNLTPESFSNKAGYYLGEINHLHPFRDGNGRTQRIFINQLAKSNNYYIAWDGVKREEMIKASVHAHQGQHELMSTLVRDNLIDYDYTIAKQSSAYLLGEKIALQDAQNGKIYEGAVIAITDRYTVQSVHGKEGISSILHNRLYLSKEPEIGMEVNISYPAGKIGLVKQSLEKKEQQKELNKNYLKNIEYEK